MATVLAALLLAAGCASNGRWGAGLDSDPDRMLQTAVYQRLRSDPMTDALSVSLDARDGVVTIHGRLEDNVAKARVLAVIKSTPGVKSVVDETTP